MGDKTEFYVEYCSRPNTRKGTMVPLFYCQNLTGFRSVYLFSEEDAVKIKGSQSSSGLNSYSVRSNQLFLDFDGKDAFEKSEEVFAKYRKHDYSVELWFSGSKGFHIVVDIEEMCGQSVSFSQKSYVRKEFGFGFCDESIYKNSALIRLPGTKHDKSGNKKHLIMSSAGSELLKIVSLAQRSEQTNYRHQGNYAVNNIDITQQALLEVLRLSSLNIGEGNRHMSLFYAAGLLAEAGYSYSVVKEILMKVNFSWKIPKSEVECMKAISDGFNKPIKR